MTANGQSNPKNALSREAIVQALFETYESLYDIDAETSAYQCYHESNTYSALRVADSGEDFFAELAENLPYMIDPEDQEYVRRMLRKDAMVAGLRRKKHYSFVYRLLLDGKPVYHKLRATMALLDGREHILLGVRNVEETIRQEKAHMAALSSLHQKETNHLEAVLASAAGYLEANLTRDLVLEHSPYLLNDDGTPMMEVPSAAELLSYSALTEWLCRSLKIEDAERYLAICSRQNLSACFARGEKRASLTFSFQTAAGIQQPCRQVFFLYRDNSSGNLMAFCVLYDLTEQQRKERELRELEHALRLSRIRNFTSQMQPHFLYNALGSIQEVLLEDPEYASELIGDFTVHLRSCIRAMASDAPLPFEQELDNIRAYVNIEKMRFGQKLRVNYEIETSAFSILPLSIQPLVENAIRHGIYQRGARGGSVTVRSRETPEAWIVEVEDDGVGFDVEAFEKETAAGRRDSTGLKNLIFRLDKVMHAEVNVQSKVGSGTKVTVKIPKGGDDHESDRCR